MDQGLTMLIAKDTAISKLLFEFSPVPIMRKIYRESVVAKGGFFTYESGDTPQHVNDMVVSGKGVTYALRRFSRTRLDLYNFSKSSISILHIHLPFKKNSWTKVIMAGD